MHLRFITSSWQWRAYILITSHCLNYFEASRSCGRVNWLISRITNNYILPRTTCMQSESSSTTCSTGMLKTSTKSFWTPIWISVSSFKCLTTQFKCMRWLRTPVLDSMKKVNKMMKLNYCQKQAQRGWILRIYRARVKTSPSKLEFSSRHMVSRACWTKRSGYSKIIFLAMTTTISPLAAS